MGADFLLALAPLPDTSPGAIAELHARVETLPERHLIEILEACLPGDDEDYSGAKALVHQAIDEIVGVNRRDVCEFVLDGVTYVATGGMSNGDDPTQAYPYVIALNASGLT